MPALVRINTGVRPIVLVKHLFHKNPPGKVLQKCTFPGLFPIMEFGSKQTEPGSCGLFRGMVTHRWIPLGKESYYTKMKILRQLARPEEKHAPMGSKPIIPGAAERAVFRVPIQPPQLNGPGRVDETQRGIKGLAQILPDPKYCAAAHGL